MKTEFTVEKIKELAPSVFATGPSPKVSDKYVFVPTEEILENFQREGWELSSVSQTGRGIHALHQLKFRNGELPKVGDTLVEAIIRNSHNGTATFQVSAGLHRLVCSNGLTVPTAISDSLKVRHQKFDLDEVKRLTETFAKRLPKIETSVGRMMERVMSTDEKIDFVRKSAEFRWKTGKVLSAMEIEGLLVPNRVEDDGDDLWRVMNVVQEKYVRGGLSYESPTGRKTALKGLKGISAVNNINTQLWELAETMI